PCVRVVHRRLEVGGNGTRERRDHGSGHVYSTTASRRPGLLAGRGVHCRKRRGVVRGELRHGASQRHVQRRGKARRTTCSKASGGNGRGTSRCTTIGKNWVGQRS